MPYVDLGDFTMFYTDHGAGDPVLCVHGWTCDGSDWSWQTPALLANHRVIAVDLRGHGKSSAPASGYTIPGFAHDVAQLLDQLRTGPVIAMGHSMGGATAVRLAVDRPDLVRAVVSVDSAFGFDPVMLDGLAPFFDALKSPGGTAAAKAFFEATFYPPACPPHLPALHGRRVESMDHGALWQSFEGLVRGEGSFALRPDSERYLPQVTQPVLTFRAGAGNPAALAEWERSHFSHPHSRAVGWEGTGHFLHQERPAEFNAILAEWIKGLPQPERVEQPGAPALPAR